MNRKSETAAFADDGSKYVRSSEVIHQKTKLARTTYTPVFFFYYYVLNKTETKKNL